jgi:hypothetical protein
MRSACWLADKRARSLLFLLEHVPSIYHNVMHHQCILDEVYPYFELSALTFVLNIDWMCVVAKLLSAKWCALCHSVVCLPSVLLNNYATWRQPTVKYYPPYSNKCSRGFRSSIRLSKLSKFANFVSLITEMAELIYALLICVILTYFKVTDTWACNKNFNDCFQR